MSASDFALLPAEGQAAADPALPLVVLLGWVGADRDGALIKYAQLLAQHGYPSIRSVQPTATAFSPFPSPRRRWALALLAALEATGLWPSRRLVLYCFSNGGAFVVEQLQLLAEQDRRYAHLPASVAGFIFDSAPAFMHPGALQRVLAETEPPGWRRTATSAYYGAARLLLRGDRRAERFWANMQRLHWGRKQLFLYSEDDHLCDGAKLSELVAAKRAAGQRVVARCWQRSGHVAHFRHHREEYTALLLGFLRSAAAVEPAGVDGAGGGVSEAAQGGGGARAAAGGMPRSRL